MRYRVEWERMSRRVGYWLDYENAYLTMSNEYIESVWWSLKELHAKGLLVRGNQVVPYPPALRDLPQHARGRPGLQGRPRTGWSW